MSRRSESYSRYLLKEKHRKQYTLTKTKLVVGFLLSLVASIFLGSYFDQYGDVLLNQTSRVVRELYEQQNAQQTAKSESSSSVEEQRVEKQELLENELGPN